MHSFKYWQKRKVPYVTPTFPCGNSNFFQGEGVHFVFSSIAYYDLIRERSWKYGGIYIMNRPVFVVRDPEYIKDILSRDFDYFTDRLVYYNEKDDPISAHLFSLRGDKWRKLRTKLTPTFSSGKLKMVFPDIVKIGERLVQAMAAAVEQKVEIDVLQFSSNFTADIICSVAFGIEANTLTNPNSEIITWSKKITQVDSLLQYISLMIIGKAPKLALKLGLVGTRPDVSEYFHQMVSETLEFRKKNNIQRPDFLQLLGELKESTANSNDPFTFEQIVAQVFVFFVAGLDTSSITMQFALYELARHPEIQEKARRHIGEVLSKHEGQFTYESLNDMKYLQQIIDEILRMYPPIPVINRICVKDYQLRDSEATIGKGDVVLIQAFGIHRDPEYYEDPNTFDPERFNPENKNKIHPFSHLAFGEGRRNCIGSRFGLMQAKIGLCQILKNYRLSPSISNKPLEFLPNTFMIKSKDTIYVKAEKL